MCRAPSRYGTAAGTVTITGVIIVGTGVTTIIVTGAAILAALSTATFDPAAGVP